MELIKMSDYVLSKFTDLIDSGSGDNLNHYVRYTKNYANFLKRPLELGMFIPCDKEGDVIKRPTACRKSNPVYLEEKKVKDAPYFEAKKSVLFGGFEMENGGMITYNRGKFFDYKDLFNHQNGVIEDLTELGLTLTDNAIKQLK